MILYNNNLTRYVLRYLIILFMVISLPALSTTASYAIIEGNGYQFLLQQYEYNDNGTITHVLELRDFSINSITVDEGENFTVIPLDVEDRPNIPIDIDGVQIEVQHDGEFIERFSPISGYSYFVDRQWNELDTFHQGYNTTEPYDYGFVKRYKTKINNETVFGFQQFSFTEQYGHPEENYTNYRFFEAYFLKSSGVLIQQYRYEEYEGESFNVFGTHEIKKITREQEILGENPPIPTITIPSSETRLKITGFPFYLVIIPIVYLSRLKIKCKL